ncbi:MAG TPA: hypothetical protein VHS55_04835 [Solirubrobacteraceae bacterium]|jgi:hypothetical protein|nr:hypothetical protein [Solirubrobacteraceae bacterium]
MDDELNPFVYDDPLPPDGMIDRDGQTRQLLALAEGGHNTRLSAPRRYGKTSIILRLLAEADLAGLHTVHVDFYRCVTRAEAARRIEEAHLARLAGPLRRTVSALTRSWHTRLNVGAGGLGLQAERVRELGNQRLADLLDLPKRIFAKSGVRTIVAFDEFQDFLRIGDGLDGLLRSKIQLHRDEASYVFAGSEPGMLDELFNGRGRPLFDQARPIPMGPLNDGDLAEYIGVRFDVAGRDPGVALELLLDLARGHPQRAMLLAHHLWEHTSRGEVANEETYQSTLEAVDRETRERFERTWLDLGSAPAQRRVLSALANSTHSLYSKATLLTFDLDKSTVQQAVHALVYAGEVAHVDRRFTIIDPLFERWLRRTQR